MKRYALVQSKDSPTIHASLKKGETICGADHFVEFASKVQPMLTCPKCKVALEKIWSRFLADHWKKRVLYYNVGGYDIHIAPLVVYPDRHDDGSDYLRITYQMNVEGMGWSEFDRPLTELASIMVLHNGYSMAMDVIESLRNVRNSVD